MWNKLNLTTRDFHRNNLIYPLRDTNNSIIQPLPLLIILCITMQIFSFNPFLPNPCQYPIFFYLHNKNQTRFKFPSKKQTHISRIKMNKIKMNFPSLLKEKI